MYKDRREEIYQGTKAGYHELYFACKYYLGQLTSYVKLSYFINEKINVKNSVGFF